MSIGALSFAQPYVLLGLLALPLIWRLLRASPPPPQERALPSLTLIADMVQHEESPARTPWWLALLRLLLAALVILAFAEPRIIHQTDEFPDGPLLLIIDDGWTTASRWSDVKGAARVRIDEAESEDRAIHILRTAAQKHPHDPGELIDAARAERIIKALRPSAWAPDRADAAKRLKESGIKPARIVWICDGLQSADPKAQNGAALLLDTITALAPLQLIRLAPYGPFAISETRKTPDGPLIIVQRAQAGTPSQVTLSARGQDGTSLALTQAEFPANATEASAMFSLPVALMNRVARFELINQHSAGSVWLREQADIRPRVGLVQTGDSGQPLISPTYYIQRALEPHAELSTGTLEHLLEQRPDAIIVSDRRIHADDPISSPLDKWLQSGGVLIRFAGPLLANQSDDFVPIPLRPAARSLGGALAWEKPQKLAPPPPLSPFVGISTPKDAFVRRQVLAEPGPDLTAHVWAKLEDGTPIVTANSRGDGMIVLFHVTATPEWSDLPYKAAFVDMLRRASLSGQPGQNTPDQGGHLVPYRVLNGFGDSQTPHGDIVPILAANIAETSASPLSPPGLYEGPAGHHALNAGTTRLLPLDRFPAGTDIIEDHEQAALNDWQGQLLSLSLILFITDIIASLALAGAFLQLNRIWMRGRNKAIGTGLAISLLTSLTPSAEATSPRAIDAALNLRLAYIETGNAATDSVIKAGMDMLTGVLRQRTSVELAAPHAVRPGIDPLELYPLIYFVPSNNAPLAPDAIAAINTYLRHGGALFIDTRDPLSGQASNAALSRLLKGLDVPTLIPVPADHVLRRSFYLIDQDYGRLQGGQLWIETPPGPGSQTHGDGVASVFIGGSDWAGAWARDRQGRPMLPMDEGERVREYTYRFGVNLVMYVLTGNYKEDQVHLPALLKRLHGRTDNPPQKKPRPRRKPQ